MQFNGKSSAKLSVFGHAKSQMDFQARFFCLGRVENSSKFEISTVTKSECFILALKLSIPNITLLFR